MPFAFHDLYDCFIEDALDIVGHCQRQQLSIGKGFEEFAKDLGS